MVNQFRYDRLTRLYSKEFFFQKAQEVLVRNPDKEYNIVCSNIVNFKLYNDTFGIPAGDRLLKNFAAAIEEFQGEGVVAGRYGGDRFVILQERAKKLPSGPFLSAPCGLTGRTTCAMWTSSGASTRSPTATCPWSICATGPCWRRTASRGSTTRSSPFTTTRCARSCCGNRTSPPPWKRLSKTTSLPSISSPSTGPAAAGSAAPPDPPGVGLHVPRRIYSPV